MFQVKCETQGSDSVEEISKYLFDLSTDLRCKSTEAIVEGIEATLEDGLKGEAAAIRIDESRNYVWFGDNQYTCSVEKLKKQF